MFALLAFLPLFASVLPAAQATCNINNPCPSAYPCCSEYGYCGVDTYCLGSCNPLSSNSLSSCAPEPVCQNAYYTFSDTSRILLDYSKFNGDANKYDWVLHQGSIFSTTSGGEAAIGLTLTQQNGGTLLSSTRFIHYGQVTARLKTGRWVGVVTAFITMSGIKDEIDWEFPGNRTTEAQTNFFWQGDIPVRDRGLTKGGLTDTFENWHDFTIDWRPDHMSFFIDGSLARTIQAADYVNSKTGVTEFPNTPSRIQMSIWPAGVPTQSPGIIHWSGGLINWTDPDYVSSGHFYALFHSVSVQCNDPTPPGPGVTSYIYGPNSTLDTPSISFSDKSTVINGANSPSRVKKKHSPRAPGGFAPEFLAHVF